MPQEIEKRIYNSIALSEAEITVLKELEELLQTNGTLSKGESIPLMTRDVIERSERNIAFAIANDGVVAVALR